jgi:hypothetical protein
MALPRKFQHLIELSEADVPRPDYVWLAYAVCATEVESCGWGGWMIEGAFQRTGERHPTGTGDRLLAAADDQRCPRCGRPTYRTGVTQRLEPAGAQEATLRPGVDYEAVPPSYHD